MSMMGHNQQQRSVQGLTPEERKQLRSAIMEMNDSMTRVGAERDLQKEIINETFDKLGVDQKMIRRLAKVYFKANFNDEVEENNQCETFYEEVLRKTVP